jgi:hypothetical protein
MNFEFVKNKSTELYILNFVPKLQPKKERTFPSPLYLVIIKLIIHMNIQNQKNKNDSKYKSFKFFKAFK